jgi:hypothetical protein
VCGPIHGYRHTIKFWPACLEGGQCRSGVPDVCTAHHRPAECDVVRQAWKSLGVGYWVGTVIFASSDCSERLVMKSLTGLRPAIRGGLNFVVSKEE